MPRKTTKESVEHNKPANTSDSKSTARKTTTAKKATARKPSSASTGAKRATRAAKTRREPADIQPQPPVVTSVHQTDQWRRMDLHMHTPGSADYEQPEIHYLDILRQAERRGLDIIAFTDHNTVNGYRNMQREIADLELLERLGRIRADEMGRLNEYRRLL